MTNSSLTWIFGKDGSQLSPGAVPGGRERAPSPRGKHMMLTCDLYRVRDCLWRSGGGEGVSASVMVRMDLGRRVEI